MGQMAKRQGFLGNLVVGQCDGSFWIANTTSMYIERKLDIMGLIQQELLEDTSA